VSSGTTGGVLVGASGGCALEITDRELEQAAEAALEQHLARLGERPKTMAFVVQRPVARALTRRIQACQYDLVVMPRRRREFLLSLILRANTATPLLLVGGRGARRFVPKGAALAVT
jgi:hypothetical protein